MSILGIVGVVLAINLGLPDHWELPVSAFLIVLIGVLGWGYRSLSTTLANLRKSGSLANKRKVLSPSKNSSIPCRPEVIMLAGQCPHQEEEWQKFLL